MKTEKLSGSIWVSKEEWETLDVVICAEAEAFLEYDTCRSEKFPIELTITAKIPERKREFTESQIRYLLTKDLNLSSDHIKALLDNYFKDAE
ncbi:MAG: hypothetical protein IMF01_09575 [Proteobacteria bacterium]|nr:hypothetical protein [Pseudomonadota bacterium]